MVKITSCILVSSFTLAMGVGGLGDISGTDRTHPYIAAVEAGHSESPSIQLNHVEKELRDKEGSPSGSHMTPVDDRDQVFATPNYPRASMSTGCSRAELGKCTFTIAFSGLNCAPLSVIGSPGVGFACGQVGQLASKYIAWDSVC